MRMAVVLPAPLGPSSTVTVPGSTVRSRPRRASTVAKRRRTPASATTGSPGSGAGVGGADIPHPSALGRTTVRVSGRHGRATGPGPPGRRDAGPGQGLTVGDRLPTEPHDGAGHRNRPATACPHAAAALLVAVLAVLGAGCGGVSGEVEPSGLSMPEVRVHRCRASEPDDGPPTPWPTRCGSELIDEGDEICDDELGGLQNLPTPSILRDAVVPAAVPRGPVPQRRPPLAGHPCAGGRRRRAGADLRADRAARRPHRGIAGALEARDIAEVDRLQPQMTPSGGPQQPDAGLRLRRLLSGRSTRHPSSP